MPEPAEFNHGAHENAHRDQPCVGPPVKNPTILFHTIDAPGRHSRIRVRVRVDEMDDARFYFAQLEISKDAGATVALRRHKSAPGKRDRDNNTVVDLQLGRVNPKWQVRYRVRADKTECKGEWVPGTSLVPDDAAEGWSIWYDPDDN